MKRATNGKKRGTTSRYRGVTLFSREGKYHAVVMVDRKRIHLGM
jgi:hypothetical protein